MFGVVLWCSHAERKAVIWCEDHGDLAFYIAEGDAAHDALLEFDAGDLVQFDLAQERFMRRANNPCLVSEGQFSDLSDDLLASGTSCSAPHPSREARPTFGQVIPFHPGSDTKQRNELRHLA